MIKVLKALVHLHPGILTKILEYDEVFVEGPDGKRHPTQGEIQKELDRVDGDAMAGYLEYVIRDPILRAFLGRLSLVAPKE